MTCPQCDKIRTRHGRPTGRPCDICAGTTTDYLGRPCRHCAATNATAEDQ